MVENCITKYNKLNQKTLCIKIETEFGLKISVATLSKIKNNNY